MILDLSSSGERSFREEAEFCVIGGGMAGLIAAKQIADNGRRVIVLESGGHKGLNTPFDALNEIEDARGLYQTAITGRARALGGTSTIWGGRMMPLTAHDMAARPYLGLSGWPLSKADLNRYLPAIEKLFGLDDTSFECDLDLPFTLERLSGPSLYIRSRWAKWPTFGRRNVANLLSAQFRRDPSVGIWLNATAYHFLVDLERQRVTAVRARDTDGRVVTVHADQFIFACGTLEVTRLLLLLDRCANGHAFAACEALGRYFNDHLAVQVARIRNPLYPTAQRIFGYHIGGSTRRSLHLETTAQAQKVDGVGSGYVTVRPEFDTNSILSLVKGLGQSAQIGALSGLISGKALLKSAQTLGPALYWKLVHKQMHLGDSVDLFLDARIEQVPTSASRLSLSESLDPFGMPKLHLAWAKSSTDERTFRAVVQRARQFWQSTILASVCPLQWELDPDSSECSFTESSRDTRHPAGSTRMGRDRRTSVVGKDLRCHAVPNVVVASAAVFPSSGSANPSLTIMQLAMLAADSVLTWRGHRVSAS